MGENNFLSQMRLNGQVAIVTGAGRGLGKEIALGWFLTEMNAEAMADGKIKAAHVSRIPLGRLGQAREIGPLVIYLASPASDFMTGSVIVMDGGELVNW